MKILKFNKDKYRFQELVQSIFDCDLDNLDNHEQKTNLTLGTDTKTAFHKVFYHRVDEGWPEFMDTYLSFLKDVIHPLFEDDVLIYQKYPGIRFL